MPSKRHQKASDLFQAACEMAREARAAFLEEACAGDSKMRAEVEALLAQDHEHPSFLEDPLRHDDSGHPPQVGSKGVLKVFLFTDLVGSTALKRRVGDTGAARVIARHDRLFRDCLEQFGGSEQDNPGDEFFATFDLPSDALRCALAFLRGLDELEQSESLQVRIGIHMGETARLEANPSGHHKLVGLAIDTTARVMSLGQPGQILLTRHAFDSVRQHVSEAPDGSPVKWRAHGRYVFKGVEEPMEVFEAGVAGLSPLKPPPDSEKAKRAVAPGDEETLGWRPAVGKTVPGRSGWTLERSAGAGAFGEVWIARHHRTHDMRAFKFCYDAERLRGLKRELTLLRLIKETSGERRDIAKLFEVRLDKPPFFLEMEYTNGGDLTHWAEDQGGVDKVPLKIRLELIAQVADALAAAHSVDIIHKDVNPSNVLIHVPKKGEPEVRLTDFGIGQLGSTVALDRANITMTGFGGAQTRQREMSAYPGTQLYMAPELVTGESPTPQSDIYALGVLLYQMSIGDLGRPLGREWEPDVEDELLRREIAACVEGRPKDRLANADELARRLRSLETRRKQRPEERSKRAPGAPLAPGDSVGPYKILEKVGEGGMGVVYVAEQREPVRRKVALKVIKLGMDTKEVLARFEVEHHALTIMNHPSIARVYDAGATVEGRPYFVMEHVPGIPINDYCDRHLLNTRQRLELFIPVCSAVQHAHQKSVIHRDLKPSNVLVMMQDGKPVPKIIDFGVAKATGQRLTERTLHTEMGQVIGTPEYMSPEQAEMTAIDIDTRTDIYSLGVILYELLVGALPFDPKSLRQAGNAEIHRIIREVDPPRPSTRLSSLGGDDSNSVAKNRRTDPSTLAKQLRGDLDWISMKAMDKDRTRRYTSASDLADDIARNLKNEPVEASPPSATYRLQKFVRRNRGLVVGASLVLLALVMGFGFATVQWFRAEANEKLAQQKATEATKATELAQQKVIEATEATEKERVARAETSRALYRSYIVLASVAWRDNDRRQMKRWLRRCPQSLRRWEWGFLVRQSDASLRTLRGHDDGVLSVAFSPDGTRIVSGSLDNTLKVWDAAGGEEVLTLRGHDSRVQSVAFSPDGTRIVSGSWDRTLKVWDAASGEEVLTLRGHDIGVQSVAFSPDGTRIVSGSLDKTIKVWDAAGGEEVLTLRGHDSGVLSVAFSPDGTRMVSGSFDKTIKVWDAAGGEEVLTLRGHDRGVRSVAFSPDGTRIVSGSDDTTLKVWDAASGEEVQTLRGHDIGVQSVAFSSDGTRIVSGSRDQTLKVWDGGGQVTIE